MADAVRDPGQIPFEATHDVKVWTGYYDALASGRKTFELRRNDRDFLAGDTLRLREWNPDHERYTGRAVDRLISYVLEGPAAEQLGLQPGFAVLGLKGIAATDPKDHVTAQVERLKTKPGDTLIVRMSAPTSDDVLALRSVLMPLAETLELRVIAMPPEVELEVVAGDLLASLGSAIEERIGTRRSIVGATNDHATRARIVSEAAADLGLVIMHPKRP